MTTRTGEREAEVHDAVSVRRLPAPRINADALRRERVASESCVRENRLPWTSEVGVDARGATRPCVSQLGPLVARRGGV
jgi:hypothetical protein